MTTEHAPKPVVVWLKRDLRLSDHPPLASAIASGSPVILLYIFEPSLIADPHYDERHWRFVWQSLEDIHHQLANHQEVQLRFFRLS